MNFLLDYGIDEETIKKIIDNNDEMFIKNVIFDKNEMIANLIYFRKIGIKRINNLLIERTDLFMMPNEIVKNNFEHFNLSTLVNLINEDICNIELIDAY